MRSFSSRRRPMLGSGWVGVVIAVVVWPAAGLAAGGETGHHGDGGHGAEGTVGLEYARRNGVAPTVNVDVVDVRVML